MSPPIIQVENLVKTFKLQKRRKGFWGQLRTLAAPEYRIVHAVDRVSFSLAPGEMVGYLGPNGAGKSTTIKILTGLLVPSSGTVLVDGKIPWKKRTEYVANIGAVFGQRSTLWWDLPVIDSLELLQPMYRVPHDRFQRNLKLFSELLEMESFLNSPTRSLSLGQRMRADLCAAFLHEPKLVFLDEPTIGLDVVAKERIRLFIRYIHRERGATIILTTHDLTDVEKLCERVMILDLGKVLYDGSLANLVDRFEENRLLSVSFSEEYADVLPLSLAARNVTVTRRSATLVDYRFDSRQLSTSELIGLLMQHYRIADLEVKRPEIEETIRRIYEGRLLQQDSFSVSQERVENQ